MQPWISKYLLYLPVQFFRREPVLRHLRDLERSQWEDPETLASRQAQRLRDLVRHAALHIPHYRNAFRAHGFDANSFRGPEDLFRIPILEKDVARSSVEQLSSDISTRKLDRRKTSGSTGIPVPVLKSRDAYARIRAIWYRYSRWYGIDIGSRQGRFLGHPVDWRARLREDIQDFILNKHRLDPVYLTPERVLAYWRQMLRTPPSHVYGYASAMVAFAQVLTAAGEDVRRVAVPTLICTGETLYPFQRDFLRESYGARVVNEYGCTESGVLAFPCPEEDRLHVSSDNVLLEFLVGDRPARAGEMAQVVLTDLYSPDAPLIRYRLGDVVVPGSGEPCPCGRGLPTIERVEGRTSQMIRLPDGRHVHSEVFSYISDTFSQFDAAIQRFRVRQTGDDAFVLQLVASHVLENSTLETLSALVRRILGESVTVDVEQVDELPRDPTGKLRYFVRDDPGQSSFERSG